VVLGLTVSTFEGFDPEDFAAFESRKWRSNRFNLERMRVRDKLALLGVELVTRAPALADGLTREVSGHTPTIFNNHEVDALWLCFRRPDAEHRDLLAALEQVRPLSETVRDPQPLHKEVLLAVRVSEEGLEVSLRLHAHAWVDAQNLLVRCEDQADCASWAGLLAELGQREGFDSLVGEHALGPGLPFDATSIAALRGLVGADSGWLLVRHRFPAADPRLAGSDCAALVADDLAALLPLRRFVAWSDATDRLDLAARLAQRRAAATAAAEAAATIASEPAVAAQTFTPKAAEAAGAEPAGEEPAPTDTRAPSSVVPPAAATPPTAYVAPEPIRDEDRRPEWARFTPAPRPPRPERGADRREPRRDGPPRGPRPRPDQRPPAEGRPFAPGAARHGADAATATFDETAREPRPAARSSGDRPHGDRVRDDRPSGDRPSGDRPSGDRPRGDRRFGDRPYGDRPRGDRPYGDRVPGPGVPGGPPEPAPARGPGDRGPGDRGPGDRGPGGDRRFGDRPHGDRPRGDRRDDRGGPRGGGRRDDRGGRRDGGERSWSAGPGEERRPAPARELKPSDAPVEARCQARVLDGLFRGQLGTVLDIDARGNAQVLIHKRTVRVEVAHLQRVE
jgi:hypothetical protein